MAQRGDLERIQQESCTANADIWARQVQAAKIESRRLVTDAAIVSAITAKDPGKILDLGCGEGWLCRRLSSHGFTVTGVDASAPLILKARELGGGDFEHMTYADIAADPARLGGSYDYVVANFSLLDEHIHELLSSLAFLLHGSGLLFIQTAHPDVTTGDGPYCNGWREERFENFTEPFPASMPWFFRTVSSWVQEIIRAGFALVHLQEPIHPDTGRPVSLLLICRPCATDDIF